jgi:uncharacterized surface protein with fasciclin (FAS1) repeats
LLISKTYYSQGELIYFLGAAPASSNSPLSSNALFLFLFQPLQKFREAVKTAGYENRLGKFFKGTVFAPTDHAWTNLAIAMNATEESILTNRALMKNILSYHMINNDMLWRRSLKSMQTYDTDLHGASLTIYKSKYGPVRILYGELLLVGNGFSYDGFASIVQPNIKVNEGKVAMQVIDRVLTPPRGEV